MADLEKKTFQKAFIFYLPFLIVILSLFLFTFIPKHHIFQTEQYKIVSSILFFNQAHILLTFFLIFSVQHFSEWRQQFNFWGQSFNKHLALIFVLFFVLVLILFLDLFQIGLGKSRAIHYFLYQIYGTQHFLFQSFGFSSHITQGALLSNTESISKGETEQIQTERKNVKLVFLSFIILLITDVFLKRWSPVLHKSALVVGTALAAFSLYQIFNSIRKLEDLKLRKKKYLFCSRYLLYPLKGLSPWLDVSAVILHGWEYIYFVDHSFKEGTGKKHLPRRWFYAFLVVELIFIIPLLFMNSPTFRGFFEFERNGLYFIMAALINAAILSHFYTDRLAFSRKHNPHSHKLSKFEKISIDLYKS